MKSEHNWLGRWLDRKMQIQTMHNKGIYLTKNGITFSIQFGAGNYCQNYENDITKQFAERPDTSSTDCEVAVFGKEGEWITNLAFPENGEHIEGGSDVIGYVPIEEAIKRFFEFTNTYER